eukprot:GHVS01082688.1.p1 GENE.GHVS01082688.1~~GHVS01082688.1.p1  ORF type:complete len:171 (-),score=37.63 GHVS01082688.1:32-544(-)
MKGIDKRKDTIDTDEEEKSEEQTLKDEILHVCRSGDLEHLNDLLALHASSTNQPPPFLDSCSSSYLLTVVDDNANTALHLAAANGHVSVVVCLLSLCPLLITSANSGGNTAVHWAVQNRQTEVVEVMLGAKHQSDPTAYNELVDVLAVNGCGRSVLGEAFRVIGLCLGPC